MSLRPGARLGPYEIVAPLGAGGMGEVYRALDARLGREVALKALPGRLAGDVERLWRFEQEARATGILNHPSVLAVYDVGAQDGVPYVVSELLEGETVRARLQSGPLPVRRAVELALQVAQGLAAAHDKGIVHRDLKPENLFVTRDGRAKILDFGLAKLTRGPLSPSPAEEASTDPGALLGTVGYMSPELVRGEEADHRSDIFSFGCVLYEMLCGQRAFHGEFPVATMNAILQDEPPEMARLPEPLEPIVRHCLEKEPQRRFQSAHDLAFALQALASPSAARWPRLLAGALRRRRAALLALLAVLVPPAAFFLGRATAPAGSPAPPSFRLLTFRRGTISAARFSPDGQTIVYAAAWDGRPSELFLTRAESPESRPLGLGPAGLLSISSTAEIALQLAPLDTGGWLASGTLARVPLAGGAPRELLEGVFQADWSADGAALAVVRDEGGKSRLEYPIGRTVYETAGWISHPRVSPSGDRIALIEHPARGDDRGVVALVDAGGARRVLTQEWVSVQGLAWAPRGDAVWFTAASGGVGRALYAVGVEGRPRLVGRVPGTLMLHDISRQGRFLLAHESLRTGIVGLAPGEKVERDLSWLDWSVATDLSDDGRTLLFSEQGLGSGPKYAVYVRRTDGSPPVRLGEGTGTALSPDGRWVLSMLPGAATQLQVLPTGAGPARRLPGELHHQVGSDWMPGGRRVLFNANQGGQGVRVYEQDLEGGPPRPLTPEGTALPSAGNAVSPDGSTVAVIGPDQRPLLVPAAGGEPRAVPGLEPGDVPVRWSADGKGLFVFRRGALPLRIQKVDLSSGARQLWREVTPADAAGMVHIRRVLVTPDGRSYFYNYVRILSELYLVDGLL